ncbi:MAG: hypothetical protein Q8N99_05475, partial [Nanoarchaeota archaeon]|nr:hypothetical protein [Nanoarchaeota archaeon]
KNFPKNRLPPAKAGGLIGDFSLTGKFFRMFGNDRTLKGAVFNVPDINKSYEESNYIKTTLEVAIIILIVSLVFANYLDIPKKTLLYKLIDEGDYDALLYLKDKPKAIVLASPAISMGVYPITGHDSVTGIFFYEKGNKEEVKKFFNNETNCSERNFIINKHKPDYIISKYDLNCSWKAVYNRTIGNKSDWVYEIKK